MTNALELAKKIAKLTTETKAINPVILDLSGVSSFTDYFVVCSANSDRQTRAISDKVEIELKREAIRASSVEGYEQGAWIVLDFFDVVLHIFTQEVREQYNLEEYWKTAKKINWEDKPVRPKKTLPAKTKKPVKSKTVAKKAEKKPVKKVVKNAVVKKVATKKSATKKTPAKKITVSKVKKSSK